MPMLPVPSAIRFQPVAADQVAARLVELALGVPAPRCPTSLTHHRSVGDRCGDSVVGLFGAYDDHADLGHRGFHNLAAVY